ncbi:FG-GAP-like repeat-containing protein [Psychroserpens damuponensis]|uniref:FG-GAP-like repeat-containing protein n=1 Tax=Psychroserpens damuponensis TaxID=943936 RepID=UPI0009FCDEE4|nr:FG-GAP-like repeat-containing protein [Psychroserpens damuponensis]
MMKYYVSFFLVCFIFNTSIAQINFQDEAVALGVGIATGSPIMGNGLSLVDFNGDGFDDITLATENGQELRFFVNTNGSFTEQILNIPSFNYQTKSVNWVDIDNDGDKDFFVTSDTNGNRLYENMGNLIFQDITTVSGINDANMYSYGASWGDYNNDGYLDVFISNRSEAIANILYHNNGDNTFTNVSVLAGISNLGHMSFCSVFFDYNNDGWQDLYISNDKTNYANILYRNNGDNTFTDESESSLTNVSIDAMTTTVGDYNNDGWFDIYVTNGPSGNVLFRNEGDGTFYNATQQSGTSFNSFGWGAVFLDAENDTDLDLYVSGQLDGSIPSFVSAAFYENLGNTTFNSSNTSGFNGDNNESYSNAVSDLNNDGLIDIVVNNGGDDLLSVWENQSVTTNNWLKVNLEGVVSNRDGIGSKIEISINGNKQYRYTHAGEGYLSQNSTTTSFGVGDATVVDYIKVTWLSGVEDVINNVTTNQILQIVEGSNSLSLHDNYVDTIYLKNNPVNSVINVVSTLPVLKLELFSLLGQKILIKYNSDQLNVSQFQSGHYLLYIQTIRGVSVKKVVIE